MTAKIDELDARIIRILLSESRTSFTAIAHQCKITVTAVRMRYKRLWRDGVINGEKMLVNPHSLGFPHIADLGLVTAVEKEVEVREFLDGKPYIGDLVGPMGQYNFWGKVALRDLNKLHDIIEDLESNGNIKHVDALIWAEAANIEYPQNLIIKSLHPEENAMEVDPPFSTNHNQAVVSLDDIDRRISVILSESSRTPFKKIASQLKISSKTVIQRYKKLRKNLLTRSTVTVDLSKLGYHALANILIKVSNRSKMPEIHAQMLRIPNVIVVIRMMGAYDLYCAIPLENFERLFEVYGRIVRISGVEKAEVFPTPVPPAWPFNLFSSLLESEYMKPKFFGT